MAYGHLQLSADAAYFECSYNSRTCGNGIDFIGALIDAEPQSRVIDWLSAWPVHLVLELR